MVEEEKKRKRGKRKYKRCVEVLPSKSFADARAWGLGCRGVSWILARAGSGRLYVEEVWFLPMFDARESLELDRNEFLRCIVMASK